MTNNAPPYHTTEVRRLLAAAFDDVGLVAFCQDEFPSLCESLGRGLRKAAHLRHTAAARGRH